MDVISLIIIGTVLVLLVVFMIFYRLFKVMYYKWKLKNLCNDSIKKISLRRILTNCASIHGVFSHKGRRFVVLVPGAFLAEESPVVSDEGGIMIYSNRLRTSQMINHGWYKIWVENDSDKVHFVYLYKKTKYGFLGELFRIYDKE